MARTERAIKSSRLVMAASVIAIVSALYLAREVLVPLCLAVLLAFLLSPVVTLLERWKLKRVLAVVVTMALALVVVSSIAPLVAREAQGLANNLDAYKTQIVQRIHSLRQHTGVAGRLSRVFKEVRHAATSQPVTSQPTAIPGNSPARAGVVVAVPVAAAGDAAESSGGSLKMLADVFTPVLGILATIFIVTILVIFMLLQREDLRDRLLRLVGEGQINLTTVAMDDAAHRVSTYLFMQTLVNAEYGALVCVGLAIFHVPNAMLWGLLAALFRFLPYVGPWLGAAIPVLLSFADPHSWGILWTIALFVVLEVINGSFIEPWLYGTRTGVSSVAVLVSAIFWGWLWGPVGLILSTPMTVILVVVGKYVPQLSFLTILLGDEQVFEPHVRYFQRLIAEDQEEAYELLDEYQRDHSLESVYQDVLIPALVRAEYDFHHGRLDAEKEQFVVTAIREHIDELSDRADVDAAAKAAAAGKAATKAASQAAAKAEGDAAAATASADALEKTPPTAVNGAANIHIICLPARDAADELAGMMFAHVLQRGGFKARAISDSALASEMMEVVERENADIVVICALPPAAATHARYLCKRLHARFPQLRLVVGLWDYHGDTKRAMDRIACSGSESFAITFGQAIEQITQMAHPIALNAG